MHFIYFYSCLFCKFKFIKGANKVVVVVVVVVDIHVTVYLPAVQEIPIFHSAV